MIRFFKIYLEQIEKRWEELLKERMPEMFKDALQERITLRSIEKSIEIVKDYCESANLTKLIEDLISLNRPPHELIKLMELFETSTYSVLVEVREKSDEEMIKILQNIRGAKRQIYIEIVKASEDRYKSIIKTQKIALQELSTPIMPVFEGVIVVPVIGTIDNERAKQMMEDVLNAVVENKSDTVLIDITGVNIIDSAVAYNIIQVVSAIHIVGGKGMIVGIKPSIAQTLVKLGVDLVNIVTLGTLQEGLDLALSYKNKRISEVSE